MKSQKSTKQFTSSKHSHTNVLNFPGFSQLAFQQNLLNGKILFNHKKLQRKLQNCKIKITREEQKTWLGIYEWRSNTELPIVRTYYISINKQDDQFVEMEIFNEHIQTRLSDLLLVPLNQILYLMKESLIGFERLFSKFGGFEINSNMIGINQNKKCKVWVNENYQLNSFTRIQIKQTQFLQKIIDIFSSYVLKTRLSKQFLSGFKKVKRFIQAFKYIDSFVHGKHIIVSFKFNYQSTIIRKVLQQEIKSIDSDGSPSINLSEDFIKKNINEKIPKAETQAAYPMKGSYGTTKANSYKEVLLSLTARNQLTEDLNQQMIGMNISTTTNKPHKKDKLQTLFKSDINLNGQKTCQTQKQLKKNRKFSAYNTKYDSDQQNYKKQQLKSIDQKFQRRWEEKKYQKNEDELQHEKQHYDEMFKKNGWQNILTGLLISDNPMKSSVIVGKDIQKKPNIKLQRLNTLGRNVKESILCSSVEQ